MLNKKRIILLVLDGFGIGEAPDAYDYGDEGANTALHACEGNPGQTWRWLTQLGLGSAALELGYKLPGCPPVETPMADFGVMAERSKGKDTTTGHWELAGVILDEPLRQFPQEYPSFPSEMVKEFKKLTGYDMLGNKAASGTEIIKELGEEHARTGQPICYTSVDSVFQIAANEKVIPVDKLYELCTATRKLCDDWNVGRVIARPFIRTPKGDYVRTDRRRDYSIDVPGITLMEKLQEKGIKTIAVGKIGDIFNETGIDLSYHDKGNTACLNRLKTLLSSPPVSHEFIFVNLVDTDMLYGHRRDVTGYFNCIANFDKEVPSLLSPLNDHDKLILTADHGCDPGFKGTDHTREFVPLLVCGPESSGKNLGIKETFSAVSDLILDAFR